MARIAFGRPLRHVAFDVGVSGGVAGGTGRRPHSVCSGQAIHSRW
ncbi:hypothetical protein ACWDV4_13765 [Micromonospora sp. NPDC003197]